MVFARHKLNSMFRVSNQMSRILPLLKASGASWLVGACQFGTIPITQLGVRLRATRGADTCCVLVVTKWPRNDETREPLPWRRVSRLNWVGGCVCLERPNTNPDLIARQTLEAEWNVAYGETSTLTLENLVSPRRFFRFVRVFLPRCPIGIMPSIIDTARSISRLYPERFLLYLLRILRKHRHFIFFLYACVRNW